MSFVFLSRCRDGYQPGALIDPEERIEAIAHPLFQKWDSPLYFQKRGCPKISSFGE